ncbi:MAG TPA: dienelactone hydrolase family protein [Candidatus Binatia bacterium]|nr:dienelactone hydrolase family protein [Candidatus Binatia bacterium]
MNAKGEKVEIQAADGRMPAHVARPDGPGPFPGVIVVMEAFGLNDHIRSVTERIAREGYLAIAPDLYYRADDRVAGYGDLQKAIGLMMQLDDRKIVDDIRATMQWLERQPGIRAGRIGITGFCMGGRVSFLSACHLPLRAAAPFYGGGIGRVMMPSERTPHPPIDDAAGIRGSLLVFYGDQDAFIPPDEVALVKERLAALGKDAEVVVYPGADHGFFCDERPSYHAAAAQDSWKRLLAFFDKHLRQ